MSIPLPQQKPRAVIFDMDGTTVRHLNERLINLVEWLDDRAYFFSNILSFIFSRSKQDQQSAHDYLSKRAQRRKPKLYGHRALHRLRRKGVDQIVEPSPGVYDVLDLLRAHNIPMGLASNGLGAGYGHDILTTFDLKAYFDATVFREDIRKSKPDPESILLTLQKLDISLGDGDVVWYIGDRRKDVKAALRASQALPCQIVPIAYTLNASIQVFKENLAPDHIIMDYAEMHDRLMDLIGSSP